MTEPYRVIHDEVFLSWEDVNAIAAELDAAGFVIVSRDRLDALEAVAAAARSLDDPAHADTCWWDLKDALDRLAALEAPHDR